MNYFFAWQSFVFFFIMFCYTKSKIMFYNIMIFIDPHRHEVYEGLSAAQIIAKVANEGMYYILTYCITD